MIISKYLSLLEIFAFLIKLLQLFSLVASIPKTLIFFETYLKLEIFISRQNIFDFGKNLEKAAADAPAYEPISSMLSFLYFNFSRFFK